MKRIVIVIADPAVWWLGAAAALGCWDLGAWSLIPMTLALTTSSVLVGSELVFGLLRFWGFNRWLDHTASSLLASFYIVDSAYVGGVLVGQIAIILM